ncbi:MAG: CBS domain-containing protein [Bacteroidia bacterium]|nr:CBS domain-containing protein [Bacteroidia bacterium]
MLCHELISEEIPPLLPTDSIMTALDCMDHFKVSHLPVIDKKKYLCIVDETTLLDHENPDDTLQSLINKFSRIFIFGHQHVFELIKMMSEFSLTLIPVVNDREEYLGNVHMRSLIYKLSELTAVMHPGGILVLELNQRDYSATQIANIVESNDAKILSMNVSSRPDSTMLEVTLKVNRDDLSGIIQTFHRYNYTIKATYNYSSYDEDLKKRLDAFLHYLNI